MSPAPVGMPTGDPPLYPAMHTGQIQGFPGLSPVCEPVDFESALRLSNPGRRRTKEERKNAHIDQTGGRDRDDR